MDRPVMPDTAFLAALLPHLVDNPLLLAEARRRLAVTRQPAVTMVWLEPKTFVIDGHQVPARGRGLVLAWLLLAGFRYRLGHLVVESLFPGPSGASAALQCLERTASRVEPFSPALARCIRCIGVQGGLFVLRAPLPARIELDAPLLKAKRISRA